MKDTKTILMGGKVYDGTASEPFIGDILCLYMTGGVTDRFSIRERAYVKPGCGESFGIEKVFINGCCVLNGGSLDADALKTTGRAMKA